MNKLVLNVLVGYALLALLSFSIVIEFVGEATTSSQAQNRLSAGPAVAETKIYEMGYYRLAETEEAGRSFEPLWSNAQW